MNALQSDVLRIAAGLNISFLIADVTGKLVGYPITQPTPLLFLWMELWKPRTLFPHETVKWTVESLKEKGYLELQPGKLFLPPGVYSHRALNGTEWTIEAIEPDEVLQLGNGERLTLPGIHTFLFACPTELADKFHAAWQNDKHLNFGNYFSFSGIGCKGNEHPHFALTDLGRENANLSAEDLLSINPVGPGPKAAAEPVKPAVGKRVGEPATDPEPVEQAPGDSESKDGRAGTVGSHDATKPDATGYVARPTDLSPYVPMATIRAKYCEDLALTTSKEITKVLEDFPANRVRWTRPPGKTSGAPHPQRRSVHLVDWETYVDRLKHRRPTTAEEGFPDPPPAEIETGKAKARRIRQVGK